MNNENILKDLFLDREIPESDEKLDLIDYELLKASMIEVRDNLDDQMV